MLAVHNFIKRLPLPRTLKNLLLYPPGHFYSPLPSRRDIEYGEEQLLSDIPRELPGIDLHVEKQLRLFDRLKEFYPSMPFTPARTPDLRYFFENETYSYADAIILHCMLRHVKPKRLVEIGAGFSSCVILDTNEHFLQRSVDCTFIEPHPEEFRKLLRQDDIDRVRIVASRVQEVGMELFEGLGAGDILFIDSTHVAKVGSDVNHLFFNVLPALKPGVIVHFHDIMYPFEYPRDWISGGRSWNEAYMLRAFLQYNTSFSILFFNSYLGRLFRERFEKEMPLCLQNIGGSIWIEKRPINQLTS